MTSKSSSILEDVAIIRPLLIVLLVFYHAFAPFSGAWAPIHGYPNVQAYWWLDKLSYAFMLESFVFVSGYVFGYQVRTKGDIGLNPKKLFFGKFKRLIVPSIVFSVFYLLCFNVDTQSSYLDRVYNIISGVGHMWFLPMLFWCFAIIWVIERIGIKIDIVLLLLSILSIFSFIPMPLHFNHALYYMLFFYLGYIIQRKKLDLNALFTLKFAILITGLFLLFFPLSIVLIEKISDTIGGG